MRDTPSGPRYSNGLPSDPTNVGSGGTFLHGGQHGIDGEEGNEPGNPFPVGGNPTVTQEMDLPARNPSPNQSHPVRQEGGTPPQDDQHPPQQNSQTWHSTPGEPQNTQDTQGAHHRTHV